MPADHQLCLTEAMFKKKYFVPVEVAGQQKIVGIRYRAPENREKTLPDRTKQR